MKPTEPKADPEQELQRDELWGESTLMVCLIATCILPFAILAFAADGGRKARRWLTLRRQCAWCKRRLGGNPFATRTTSGICNSCLVKM